MTSAASGLMTEHDQRTRGKRVTSTEKASFCWQWSLPASTLHIFSSVADQTTSQQLLTCLSSGLTFHLPCSPPIHLYYCLQWKVPFFTPIFTPSVHPAFGSLLTFAQTLDELEALGLIVGQSSLKQHRVHTKLRVQQRHVAVDFDEEVDALVSLVEMRVIVRKGLRAARTAESPTRRHLKQTAGGQCLKCKKLEFANALLKCNYMQFQQVVLHNINRQPLIIIKCTMI